MRRLRSSIRWLGAVGLLAWIGLTLWVLLAAWRTEERIIYVESASPAALVWLALTPVAWTVAFALGSRATIPEPSYYRVLAEKTGDALLVYTPNGDVAWSNHAGRNLFPRTATVPSNMLALAQRAQKRQNIVTQVVPFDGARRYSVQAIPLPDAHTALIIRANTNDGGRSQFYENFIRRIVHDMRNPLAAIIGHAANLRGVGIADADQVERSAATIEHEAQRLSRLVDSMLFDARLAYVPLAPERLDLVELVEEAMYILEEQTLETDKQIALEMPSEPAQIEGDRDLLARAFENLLDNSLKYTDNNGRVLVRLEVRPDGHYLSFSDNGMGIPPEYLPHRIFEPLVRAVQGGGGSGLGLSIVKKIIEMHGGTIRAESKVGKGTVMMVYLPKRIGEFA